MFEKNNILIIFALLLCCTSVSLISLVLIKKRILLKQKILRKEAAGITNNNFDISFLCSGVAYKILQYIVKISYYLHYSQTATCFTKKFVKQKKLNSKIKEQANKANLPVFFDNYAYREVQFRLCVVFSLGAGLIGMLFSNLLMIIMFVLGAVFALIAPSWSMKQEKIARTLELEKNLPEMLEVISLGLRSGLTFDKAFSIYTEHFNNEFSNSCSLAQKKWNGGVCSRDDALKTLSKSYDSYLFARVVDNIIRSIRFGSSLVESLEDAAVEARNSFKLKQEEIVAKAPVKMMIPTGTLILPSMLLLVLGPVILELSNGI